MADIQWLLDLIRAMGVAGGPVFAILFWLERQERKACQKESKELLVQVLTATAQMSSAVADVTKAVAVVGDGTKDTIGSLAQLAQLVRSLGNTLARKEVRIK